MSAGFFSWLSDAAFYASAHAQAVGLVDGGQTWTDVGCGPGVVALAAARRGYTVRGFDRDAAMIDAARARAASDQVTAQFDQGSLEALEARADVVSAASLLAVLPGRQRALEQLWALVSPGGALLVIETTERLRWRATLGQLRGRGALGLLLWGLVRNGRSAARELDAFSPTDLHVRSFHPLLDGLLGAWIYRRGGSLGRVHPLSPGVVP
jgi:SAM-dependent methyltransferase